MTSDIPDRVRPTADFYQFRIYWSGFSDSEVTKIIYKKGDWLFLLKCEVKWREKIGGPYDRAPHDLE